ncbi:MAG: S41 family peptidase [Planctomycetota bacterium]
MQQQPRLPLWFLAANWALIAGAFVWGLWLGEHRGNGALVGALPEKQVEALAIVHREILRSHVDPQRADHLLERAIAGMVKGLDPYSRYVPPAEVANYEEANTGHYQGIGAEFHVHGDDVVLHFPLAGGPAEQAGLQPGDLLVAVDDTPLDSLERRTRVVDLVRGPADTDVRLTLRRDGAPLTVTLRRADVQRSCVKWTHFVAPEAGLGYLHLTDFHPGACDRVLAAIASLQASQPLRGLILDLRWNGGGSLEECVNIARAFVRSGLIVSQQRRDSEVVERHEAKAEQCLHPDLPLVLLVNEHSASASEVLAGALQDHGRAAIVGARTHGKAFVNTVYTWQDQPFRLKLTTGRYRTPNGRDIERHHHANAPTTADAGGIPPDVAVALPELLAVAVAATLRASEVPAASRETFAAVAARYGVKVNAPPKPDADAQLAAAIKTLQERAHDLAGDGGPSKDK